jgi:hypothetical protein
MSKTRSFEPSINGKHWTPGAGPAVKKAYHKSVRQMVRGHGGKDRMVANHLTEIKYKAS